VKRARIAAAVAVSAVALTAVVSLPNAAPRASGAPAKTIPSPPTSAPTGIALRAAASLPEFLPVVNAIIGSTGDVATELATLADVPTGIPSPHGSSIRGFSVGYFGLDEHFVATATFVTTATAEDTVVFYQASLSASGFTPVADSGPAGETSARSLRFQPPASRYSEASVEVDISRDGDGSRVELTIVDAIDSDVLNAFRGWAAGLPELADAEPMEAAITVTSVDIGPAFSLTVTTRFAVAGYTPDALAAAVRAALPDGGFALDPGDSGTGRSISLRHVAMQQVTCEIGTDDADEDDSAVLTLSGTVTL
jgi:hypothetical protein